MSNKVLNDYIKEVKKNLTCKKSDRIFYASMIHDEIAGFAGEKEDLTITDLCNEFGVPESFAVKLISNEEYHSLLKKAKKKALIWMVVAVAVIIVAIFCIHVASEMLSDLGGDFTIYNETIERS